MRRARPRRMWPAPARASPHPARPPPLARCLSRYWHPGASAPSGASGSDVDLPADAVLVGDGAEGVAPELPFQLGPYGAVLGEGVEHVPQPRVVGADEGQFDAGLRIKGCVLAVAGPQGDVTAAEQSVDDLIPLLGCCCGGIDIAAAGDGDLTAEDPLVEGNRLLGVAGEEQVGVELDRHDVCPFQERGGLSASEETDLYLLIHRGGTAPCKQDGPFPADPVARPRVCTVIVDLTD